ncbi:hypothetical protein O9992_28890 [Vibrio lentus]|nr:hypothetical protein [Vibrio lentus]
MSSVIGAVQVTVLLLKPLMSLVVSLQVKLRLPVGSASESSCWSRCCWPCGYRRLQVDCDCSFDVRPEVKRASRNLWVLNSWKSISKKIPALVMATQRDV